MARCPSNIAAIAAAIIRAAKQSGADNLQEQLDYTLSLVAWSGVAAKCGVQLALLDTLIDAGADPNRGPDEALVNGHPRPPSIFSSGAQNLRSARHFVSVTGKKRSDSSHNRPTARVVSHWCWPHSTAAPRHCGE